MPQPIPPLALLQEELAVPTGCGISKGPLVCHAIVMNSHDIQVTASELTNIAYLLDHVAFRMNGVLGEATALRSGSYTIGSDRKNFSSPDHHSHVEAGHVCLPHSHRIRVHEELLNQRVITGANGPGHI